MKKICCFFILLLASIHAFAQDDNILLDDSIIPDSLRPKIHFILKTNPTLAFSSFALGEIGVIGEVDFPANFGFSFGYGYCTTTPTNVPPNSPPNYQLASSGGNTLRFGAYLFLPKRFFFSAQLLLRYWQPTTVYDYHFGSGIYTDYAVKYTPFSSDPSETTPFDVDQSTATLTAFDVLIGGQVLEKGYNKGGGHLFLDWFIGTGVRSTNVNTITYGTFLSQGSQWNPNPSPVSSSQTIGSIDFKLGIEIGLIF